MDFSHQQPRQPQQFFAANPGGGPGYNAQFIGLTPLTPSENHSNSIGSEEFNNQSPPDIFDGFPTSDQSYPTFDHYAAYNNSNAPRRGTVPFVPPVTGPPTPPTSVLQGGRPPRDINGNGQNHAAAEAQAIASGEMEMAGRNNNSNSDEDDMTPVQSRRKAQNRAAQRAFRERKERHVKDLEARLAELQDANKRSMEENEQLKRDLHKVNTENEILRATSGRSSATSPSETNHETTTTTTTTGPQRFDPTDFYSELLANHLNKTPSHRIAHSEKGERLLAAGATWDLITGHELFGRGLVDVDRVCQLLKSEARCDGQGPVFEEGTIIRIIHDSVYCGSDELL